MYRRISVLLQVMLDLQSFFCEANPPVNSIDYKKMFICVRPRFILASLLVVQVLYVAMIVAP
jgi:hypothetical protein